VPLFASHYLSGDNCLHCPFVVLSVDDLAMEFLRLSASNNIQQLDAIIVVYVHVQISRVSRALGNAAEFGSALLQGTCAYAEKHRHAILLGCIKHGLRKRQRGFDLASVPMDKLGNEFRSSKNDTQYKDSKLSITSFMQQEKQRAFFWLSPANVYEGGHRHVIAHVPAFVAEPTQQVRSLLPYVDWQQKLLYNPEQAFPTADGPSYDKHQNATATGQMPSTSIAPLDLAALMKPVRRPAQDQASADPATSEPTAKEVCYYSYALQGVLFGV